MQQLPYLERIQRAFGRHGAYLGGIDAYIGGPARVACDALSALAYTYDRAVAFDAPPDLYTATHEAAHVVQQRGGVQLEGDVEVAGDPHEQHADAVAARVVAGQSSEALLDAYTAGAPSEPRGPAARPRGVQLRRRDRSPTAPTVVQAQGSEFDVERVREYAKKVDPFVADLLQDIDLSGTLASSQPVHTETFSTAGGSEKHTWALLIQQNPQKQSSSLSMERLTQRGTDVLHEFQLILGTKYRYESALAQSDLSNREQTNYQIGSRLAHEFTHVALNIQAVRQMHGSQAGNESRALAGFTRFKGATGDKEIEKAKVGLLDALKDYLNTPGVKVKPGESADSGYRFIENELYVKFLIQQNYRLDKDATDFANAYTEPLLDLLADRSAVNETLQRGKYASVRAVVLSLAQTIARRLDEQKFLETLRSPASAELPSLERQPRGARP